MTETPRLKLPLLASGQAQKELFHNEALILLDMVVQGVCVGGPSNTPPTSPAAGEIFFCGSAPTGAWSGKAGALAMWTDSGWRFVPAVEGLQLRDRTTGHPWQFFSGQWIEGQLLGTEVRIDGQKVVGARRPAISDASGGTVVDTQARVAVNQILAALRVHGLIEP